MRRLLTTAALLGFLGLSSVPAQADVAWLGFGPRFLAGGIQFVLSFGQPGLSYPRGNYYRTSSLIISHGARCSAACFHSGSIYYHHEGCPLVREHFARLGYDPYDVYVRYAPRAYFPSGRSYCYDDYFRGYGNRGYDHRDRDGRYDSYRSNRYDSGRYSYGRGGYGSSYGNRGYGDRDHRDYDHQGRGNYDHQGRGNYDNRDRGNRGNQDRGNNYGNRDNGQRWQSRDGDRDRSRGNGQGRDRSDRNDSSRGRQHGRSSGSRR